MSLSDLPDDILNLISIRLNGFDNCSLWMASDSILRQRLVNNVITDFNIEYTIPGRYLWPGNFLKKLSKLSRLSLAVDQDIFHLPIQNIELFPIPTLKYLKLDFGDSLKMFERSRLISSNNPAGPTTSSNNYYIHLNDYYSNLEHLEIMTPWLEDTYPIDFLGRLPQKLQSLSLPAAYFELSVPNIVKCLNRYIEKLPRTLTSLNIRFDSQYKNKPYLDLSKLPPNLTSLTTNVWLDQDSYPMIPKCLKSLSILSKRHGVANLSPFLPTGLESFSIAADETSLSSHLFSHLPNLKILYFQGTNPIDLDDFLGTKCPSKLENFTCHQVMINDVNRLPSRLFSDCLTKLVLNNRFEVKPELISSLPQSLTELTLGQFPDAIQNPFAYFSLLPRKLKSLITDLSIVEHTSLLPETLKSLHFKTRKSCESSFFDRLPSKLENLVCRSQVKVPRSIMGRLPESLIKLSVTSDDFIDDEIIRMLPRGLKELSLESADKITDAGAADLPPNLLRLVLLGDNSMTDNAIALLPRSLTFLNIAKNPNFTDDCIKHLPGNLVSLCLNNATMITSKSCKDLPRYLKQLSLTMCKDWDPKQLEASKNELPQYIKNIYLGNLNAQSTWKKIMAKEETQDHSSWLNFCEPDE